MAPATSGLDAAARPEIGDPIVHLARYDAFPTFGLSKCDDCTFDDLTIRASPSASFSAGQSSGLLVRKAVVAPAAGRHHATNADGCFVLDSRVGPRVLDSQWLAIGDDGLIVKTFSAVRHTPPQPPNTVLRDSDRCFTS